MKMNSTAILDKARMIVLGVANAVGYLHTKTLRVRDGFRTQLKTLIFLGRG